MSNDYETPLTDKYYAVLELPFNILLVYKYGVLTLQDAEEVQLTLPWFSVWTQEQLDNWQGDVVYIPVKQARNLKDQFTMKVTLDVPVEAPSAFDAHKEVRQSIQTKIPQASSIRTRMTTRRVNLRREQPSGRSTGKFISK